MAAVGRGTRQLFLTLVHGTTMRGPRRNTIINYYYVQQGPAPAPDAQLEGLFTGKERRHTTLVQDGYKKCPVLTSYAQSTGSLKGGCYGRCKNKFVDIKRFAPRKDSHNRDSFMQAVQAYRAAHARDDKPEAEKQRTRVEALRVNMCDKCRDSSKLPPAQQACKEEWDRMKREACAAQDGCVNKDCPERGSCSCSCRTRRSSWTWTTSTTSRGSRSTSRRRRSR